MAKRGRRLTILVAQQEDYERESMVALLRKGTIDVLEAKDGKEALNLVRSVQPDILVTDVALEKVDGLELIRKGRESHSDLKVVVAFGPYSPRSLVRAVELGVDVFVSLPVDGRKLRAAVMKCAKEIATARRMAQADYSLRQLLDFFPSPAVLVDGYDVTYINRRLADYLGYTDYESMSELDMGVEDFIVKVNGETYDTHPTHWIRDIIEDQLDRDHMVHIENPRHPDSRPNAFGVTFNQFPGSDLRLFTFQDVSGLEDERAHLEDEASTDPLTKALNRRSFLRQLGQMAASGASFSLVMFDIDHFKSINDTYGHDVGDAVLREISQLVRDNVRENDTLARWGGEEFMVLSKSDMERAKRVAERLRHAVEIFSFTGVPRQITSSFGVALHEKGESADDLVKRADEALYEAKETGRNKVVVG
ncbi:diguanylate cyclase [Pseudodesulfovibrio sp. zrk46]|uniref:GGDEF domain-containing response regulator n=1 Tax=Pseudodesulfovibrio sp. zrk46 TaxID=2725288 RepID=UPI001449592E|nr:diguanylate cyclase [Pseudodesulfovibrio sp. zrk46]QJB55873.1 diguanylate cyclase [Pseudodesulfovibrio sp. zrk46]